MVLPPPAADNESGPRDADWIEQIKLGLRLNRAGILIHVDHGRPEHLGKLVRALLPEHPNLDVFTDVRAVGRAEPGSVFILVPKPEDAEWLNLNRPIFAQRQLKVVLYCDHPTTLALADRAVDFFDWVSQHHVCPDGPPDFAVQGFRKAVAANAPGIVWTGEVEGLVRVLDAAFPGETLRWVLPARTSKELADRIRAAGDDWVACRIRVKEHVYQFRQALALIGKQTCAIALMERPGSPGWWPVNDARVTLRKAQAIFVRAGLRRPGRLVALTGLEKEAVEIAYQLLNGGVNEADLLATLCSESDSGIGLAQKAYAMGLVKVHEVALRGVPAPFLRALDDAPNVSAWRKARKEEVERCLLQGQWVNAEEIGFWVATTGLAPSFEDSPEAPASRAYLIEGNYLQNRLDVMEPADAVSLEVFHQNPPVEVLKLSAKTIACIHNGEYFQALLELTEQDRFPLWNPTFPPIKHQICARLWLDLYDAVFASGHLLYGIEFAWEVSGISSPLFAELMVDLALLLHRTGDASTAFALLRKLLATEWASLHVDSENVAETSAKPTPNSSVNDFIHLFLAQSNTPPRLPPESRARALRILAEVLLSQGRYEEAEEVAQKANEAAINAPEIARPETWRALAIGGRTRALQGRAHEGKKNLERAIELATNDFGKTHAEVARLWLDLVRIQVRIPDSDATDMIHKVIEIWKHAECDVKERDAALEELRRMIQ